MNRRELLKNTGLFVLDMDGTFYLESQILDGALDFLRQVERLRKKYLFFTNNSSRSAEAYMDKLAGMGARITREQIMTSGDVMIQYLKTCYPGKTVYLLGTPDLERSFREGGIPLTEDHPQIVVVGFDQTLTYDKLSRACKFIRSGAEFLATHLDINCPVKDGFIPDCGAICAAISLSTGKTPRYVGKPFAETVDMILKVTQMEKTKISFVGDRIYTDVKTGVNNGANGILVLSGETRPEDLYQSDVVPDAVFQDLREMAEMMKTMETAES
ncbi:MAG: HAD-IIA family hydrolase [Clostridiales bacterium]|nr:HAD-IIA family hydrolase [Clostridiales bacterium]